MQEMQVQSLGQEDPLEKKMAIHSGVLAWRIPWTEEPGGCSPWDRRVRHDWSNLACTGLLKNGLRGGSLMIGVIVSAGDNESWTPRSKKKEPRATKDISEVGLIRAVSGVRHVIHCPGLPGQGPRALSLVCALLPSWASRSRAVPV